MANTSSYGKLYLFPTPLGSEESKRCIPEFNTHILENIRFFVVEELRTARRFLRKVIPSFPIDDCNFQLLNEHTKNLNAEQILAPLLQGNDMGLLSEAGLPCIADPGSELVYAAQQKGITIVPLAGGSSIFMALMASGLSGQSFTFHGYLPTDKQALTAKIQSMETLSVKNQQTQIFMETPYRNNQLMENILAICGGDTSLCIAANITLPTEYIMTKTVSAWKKQTLPNLHKQPVIFILQKK